MNETYGGGIGSFVLSCMIVSFLQMRRRLENFRGVTLAHNLGSLLLEFFNLYGGSFNYYHTGVSIADGGSYFRKREKGEEWANPSRPNLLAIENPDVPEVDMGRNSFNMPKIRRTFEHASQLLTSALADQRIESFLSFVIRPDDQHLAGRPPVGLSACRANSAALTDSPEKRVGDGVREGGGAKVSKKRASKGGGKGCEGKIDEGGMHGNHSFAGRDVIDVDALEESVGVGVSSDALSGEHDVDVDEAEAKRLKKAKKKAKKSKRDKADDGMERECEEIDRSITAADGIEREEVLFLGTVPSSCEAEEAGAGAQADESPDILESVSGGAASGRSGKRPRERERRQGGDE